MKTTSDFLDDLQAHYGVNTDYALAPYIGLHRQQLSYYRKQKGAFDDETCLRFAEILGEKPAFLMACMHYQRAKNPKIKDAWQYLGGLAAALALVMILPSVALDNGFNSAFSGDQAAPHSVYYVK